VEQRSGAARRPTLADVAAHVGVSKALASLVLRDAPGPSAETRSRVLRAAEELGYRTNRTASLLASRRTRQLGVLMNVRSPFHAELVEEIQVVADELGYAVVLSTVTRTHDEHRVITTLQDFRCEGLILLGPEGLGEPELDALGTQLPVVVVGSRVASAALDVVRAADDEGVGQVVEHLVGLGHRDIVHLGGSPGPIGADRRRGYEETMRRFGLGARIRVLPGDHTEAAGARAASALLDGGRPPTAVVASNDRSAIGLLDALWRARVEVPGTISVAGYDDSALAQLAHVALTTVNQDHRAQALHAVRALVERLDEGRTQPREVVLRPRLVVRSTTGPAGRHHLARHEAT